MFNKETLQHIEAQALIAAAKPICIDGGAHIAVLPESATLRNLEPFKPVRDRFRGHLHTHSIKAFSNYVEKHDDADEPVEARGFIDQDKMTATIIFNLGNKIEAGHGDDTATLTLRPTAAYTAVQGIAGKILSQQALAEWLEDWATNIQGKTETGYVALAAAINAVRRMTIKATSQRDSTVGDFSASRSSMDEIEAKSADILPTGFIFTTIPYEGLQPAAISLRLSVLTGGDAPMLKLRWVGEEAQREAFADEFKSILVAEIAGMVPLTIGTFTLGK